MGDVKVSFQRLEGKSFETGQIILKAVLGTRSVILTTTFKQIADLQENLAKQLGNIYTERFQSISLKQLELCGGVLIDFFFDDAIGKEYITHNEHFLHFLKTVQKTPVNKQKQINIEEKQQVQSQKYQNEKNQINQQQRNFMFKDDEMIIQQIPKIDFEEDNFEIESFEFINTKQQNKLNFDDEVDISYNKQAKKSIPSTINKQLNTRSKMHLKKNKNFKPIENIYLNNRELLDEKVRNDKKYIKFSKYFRSKIKQKLKFLFKHRKNLQGQTIQKCFDCCKCGKSMYLGIRCFKCKLEDIYYCNDCNTKCPSCGILLKRINDHVNICNFQKIMNHSSNTCQACRDDIPLIHYEEHLYQCEDNEELCKYCQVYIHFRDLKKHVENDCQQKPVTCNICNAKYAKCKQTSHRCIKRLNVVHNQIEQEFGNLKQFISNKFSSIEDKLKLLNKSNIIKPH